MPPCSLTAACLRRAASSIFRQSPACHRLLACLPAYVSLPLPSVDVALAASVVRSSSPRSMRAAPFVTLAAMTSPPAAR